VFVPVDVVKERLQVQRKGVTDPSMNYRGSVDAVRTIMRNEGLRGIYKGYGATLLSFGPFSAFHFLFYETVRRFAMWGRRLLLNHCADIHTVRHCCTQLKKWAAKQSQTTVETLPFTHVTAWYASSSHATTLIYFQSS